MEKIMLVVDDSRLNREILSDIFKTQYTVLKAENGTKALELINEYRDKICILILDLLMPDMSGFDVLKQKSEIPGFSNIPVIVITGSGDKRDQLKAFELGASDFINKPFEADIVISRVNSVVSSYMRMQSISKETEQLKEITELDQMTGLLNKTTSENMIQKVVSNANGRLNVLFVIDIDNFKSVNDLHGHQEGDHVICVVANIISGIFRKSDIIGRIGGDEFVIMMIDISDMDIVYKKADSLMETMNIKRNMSIPKNISLSVGISSNNSMPSTYKEMFEKADHALQDAKNNGKGCFSIYGAENIHLPANDVHLALLITQNRNISSTVHALIMNGIKVKDYPNTDSLNSLPLEARKNVQIIYVDASLENNDSENIWTDISKLNWIDMKRVIAICREGDLTQCMYAIQNHVADILFAPLDSSAFKRRSKALLHGTVPKTDQ